MLYRVALAYLLVGCGRVEFGALDAAGDTPVDVVTGHDEDGDGLPDVIDPCPHVAGDATDGDGDGVGDACDPNPTLPTEHIALFATMQPGDVPFIETPDTPEADDIRLVGDNALNITRQFVTLQIEIGWEILGLTANPQHQVASGIPGTSPYYFVELNTNTGGNDLAIVSYDQTNGYVNLSAVGQPGVHAGRGLLRYDVTPGTFHVVAGWVGELYETTAGTPAYDMGTAMNFAFNGLDVRVLYLVLIETK